MKIKLYKDPREINKVKLEGFQEVTIENQVVKYSQVFDGKEYRKGEGEAIFTFTEEFGYKGVQIDKDKVNIKIEYFHFIEPAHKMLQRMYAHATRRQLKQLRKSFGKLWWQKPENKKWILSFIVSLIAIGISIWALTKG